MYNSNPLLGRKPSLIWSYGIAVLSVASALIVAQWPVLNLHAAPVSLLVWAVMLAAWLGGVGPGLFAAGLSAIGFYYYFLPPTHSFAAKPGEIPRLIVFGLSGLFVGSLSAAQRRATESLVRARDELKETVHELKKANEALQAESAERKHTEKKLQESEGYLAEAQRLSHTGSWARVSATGEIRYWSEECCRVLGFDPQGGQPDFETFLRRVHPDDQATVRERAEAAGREKVDYELDCRIVHPDGGIRDIHVIGHPVVGPSGDLAEFVGTVMDVTERRRAEALREGESQILEMIARDARLEDILDNLMRVVEAQHVGLFCSVLLLDEDGQHVRHGAAPSLPKPYIDAINGLRIGPNAGSCGTAMYRREPVVVTDILEDPLWEQYRGLAEPYNLRACWSTPILSHPGKALGSFAMYYHEPRSPSPAETHTLEMATHLAGIAIERQRAEQELRRSEAYLAEGQRLTHTGSWAFNVLRRELIHSSEEHSRLNGFDPERAKPSFEEFVQRIHPDDGGRVIQAFENAARAGRDFDMHFRVVLPDGATRYQYGTGHPVFNSSGDVIEFVGIVMDVTERKLAEEERERLRQAQADLAHLNRVTMMGELTASLAHEVNQSIAAAVTDAKTCIRWLTRDEPDLEEARAAAARAMKDAIRAGEITNRIRLLFKKGTPQSELVDINEVVRETIVILNGEASRHLIRLRAADLTSDLPKVMGDRVQLQQVLMNLMINGIDAMKEVDSKRELVINSQRATDRDVVVSVSDTGVGLPPQQAGQIFNPFFTTKLDGTGMGLRISRSIIESHGGRLWAAEHPPRGARFYFTLPIGLEALE
jgi:PAS domain S-box-containing protein